MGNDNIIEFNGKRYDALTGKLLGKSKTAVAEPLGPSPAIGRTIDGVVRRKSESASIVKPTKKTEAAPPEKPSGRRTKPHRQLGKTIKPHRPQGAKTLMRRSVQKPSVTRKPAMKPHVPAEVKAKPVSGIAVKHSAHHVDPVREHRARRAQKSEAVRRFPAAPEHHAEATPIHHTPQPAASHAAQPQQQTTHHTNDEHQKTDIFEAAIARANSHKQPPHKNRTRKHQRRHRAAGILAGIAAFLILGGFLTYLNMPKIELKVASFSAGFNAQIPSYTPVGYELAGIDNRLGKVTLDFRSGEKHYKLSQQPSDWTSQTLRDNIIAGAGHETIKSKGRIIYMYDGVASWISGGVRYDLTGNAELDADEVAEIAGST